MNEVRYTIVIDPYSRLVLCILDGVVMVVPGQAALLMQISGIEISV